MFKITNLIFYAFILSILVASYVMLVPPTWVIDKQLAALQAGDIDAAYSYTSDNFQKENSLASFKTFTDQIPALSSAEGMTINEESIDVDQNHSLVVKGFIRYNGSKQLLIEYTLIRSPKLEEMIKGWKIQSIKIQDQGTWKEISIQNTSGNF